MEGGGGKGGFNLTDQQVSKEQNVRFKFVTFCAKHILMSVFSYLKASLMEPSRNVPPVVVEVAPSDPVFYVGYCVRLEIILVRTLVNNT